MRNFIIRELTQCEAVFYNEDQSVVGTLRALHKPCFCLVYIDKHSEEITEEEEEFLSSYFFSSYHRSRD